MTTRMMVARLAPGLVAGLIAACVLPAQQARAQAALPSPNSIGPVVKGGSGLGAPQPSAAGLPGARRSATITKGAVNSDLLSPNDQLFDSIDRGDITSARDAIARGADLGATDAVGQTPIDESVALGRNDITFLLVTLLHANGSQITDAQGPMAMPPANTLGLSSKDQKAVAAPVSFFAPPPTPTKPRHIGRFPATRAAAEIAPAPVAASVAPPAYADTSGAPVPSAGFVGFGSSAQ
jgi:hypothetical protein